MVRSLYKYSVGGGGGGGGAGCGKTYRLWVLDQYLGVDEPLRV